jgi:uncharacterized protein YqjF (DUF2071 family)
MEIETILAETAHRPWPLPASPWAMRQSWIDLLFAHWRVDTEQLRAAVPRPLELDLFEGEAWVGVVPFAIRDLGVRSLPGVPTATDFLELNVRTYVRYRGLAGVFFFTLEASSLLAVAAARIGFGLPYHDALMSVSGDGEWIDYSSRRTYSQGNSYAFRGRYRPIGPPAPAVSGTREHFLTERYALFTVSGTGSVTRVDIHHAPWPLQPAEASIMTNSIFTTSGVLQPNDPPLLHYSAVQHVINWAPVPG